jgi:hypothetical protein
MTLKQAVKILMESPLYFWFDLETRRAMVREFRARFSAS